MTDEDKVLWAAFRAGADGAFEGLLRAYYKSLLEYGFRFIKDRDTLQDQVHDLFINLWERRIFLNPDVTSIKLYLFISLKNQIFKYLQKNGRQAHFPDDWQEQEPVSDDFVENRLIEQEIVMENQSRLQQSINRLSKRQQEILHLKYYEALNHEQIAEVMAITQPAVRNLLSQSLKAIREQWGLLLIVSYHFLR